MVITAHDTDHSYTPSLRMANLITSLFTLSKLSLSPYVCSYVLISGSELLVHALHNKYCVCYALSWRAIKISQTDAINATCTISMSRRLRGSKIRPDSSPWWMSQKDTKPDSVLSQVSFECFCVLTKAARCVLKFCFSRIFVSSVHLRPRNRPHRCARVTSAKCSELNGL